MAVNQTEGLLTELGEPPVDQVIPEETVPRNRPFRRVFSAAARAIIVTSLLLTPALDYAVSKFIKPAEASEPLDPNLVRHRHPWKPLTPINTLSEGDAQQIAISQVFNLSAESFVDKCKDAHLTYDPSSPVKKVNAKYLTVYFKDMEGSKEQASDPKTKDNIQKLADAASLADAYFIGTPISNTVLTETVEMLKNSTEYKDTIKITSEIQRKFPSLYYYDINNGTVHGLAIVYFGNWALYERLGAAAGSFEFVVPGDFAINYTNKQAISSIAHEGHHAWYEHYDHNKDPRSLMFWATSPDDPPKVFLWEDVVDICTGRKWRVSLPVTTSGYRP